MPFYAVKRALLACRTIVRSINMTRFDGSLQELLFCGPSRIKMLLNYKNPLIASAVSGFLSFLQIIVGIMRLPRYQFHRNRHRISSAEKGDGHHITGSMRITNHCRR